MVKNAALDKLISTAAKARHNFSLDQLMTLATATANTEARKLLETLSIQETAEVKTKIAAMYSELNPKAVKAKDEGTVFGLSGKDTKIATEGGQPVYNTEPSETTAANEDQRDMRKRSETAEFHPETSDRKTQAATVAEALSIKTEFKNVLDRGQKREVTNKKEAGKKTAEAYSGPRYVEDSSELETQFLSTVQSHYDKTGNIITQMGSGATGVKDGVVSIEGFKAEYEDGAEFVQESKKTVSKKKLAVTDWAKMYMNTETGSVAPLSEWKSDYDSTENKWEWFGFDTEEKFLSATDDGENPLVWDNDLVPVEKDEDGSWREVDGSKKEANKKTAGYPVNHLMKNPAGTWSFVGSVSPELSYTAKDGSPLTPEMISAVQQAGPGMVGVKTLVYQTPEEALQAAADANLEVTVSKEYEDTAKDIGVKYTVAGKKIATTNAQVIEMFVTDSFPKDKMPEWGTPNLKITKKIKGYDDIGWALMNYQTPILYRNLEGEVFFNTDKYSNTTTTIQNAIRKILEDQGVSATETDEAGITQAIDKAIDEQAANVVSGLNTYTITTGSSGQGQGVTINVVGGQVPGVPDGTGPFHMTGKNPGAGRGQGDCPQEVKDKAKDKGKTTTKKTAGEEPGKQDGTGPYHMPGNNPGAGRGQGDCPQEVKDKAINKEKEKTATKKIAEVMPGEQVGIADPATGEQRMVTVDEQAVDPSGVTTYIATDESGTKVVIPEGTDVIVNTETIASKLVAGKQDLIDAISEFDGNLTYELDDPEVYGIMGSAGPARDLYFDTILMEEKSSAFLKQLLNRLQSLSVSSSKKVGAKVVIPDGTILDKIRKLVGIKTIAESTDN